MSTVLLVIRVALGFLYLGITFWFNLLALLILLPSRRARVRVTSLWAKSLAFVCVWLSGIEIQFSHRERLKRMPPAIYVSNHVSMLDVFLAMWILPIGTTAVAKKQIKWVPLFGVLYAMSGSLMLDRKKRTASIAELQAQSKFLVKNGFSVAIWPEGTRSRDGRLLPFQKGFAHMALWTRLPIVPVVVSGAHKAWQIGGFRIQSDAKVHVEICEPISTENWSRKRIDSHIEEVHRAFRERLPPDQQPESPVSVA
ncbi:MAG TPA: lysophospholipid acyltransferase family protein [Polyangiaceae bacterium]